MLKVFCLMILLSSLALAGMPSFNEQVISPDQKMDSILVIKSAQTLTVFYHNRAIKTYPVALGRNPVGAKKIEGDGKTPEGKYLLDQMIEVDKFHKAFHINYPNAEDLSRGRTGSAIMVHGLPEQWGFFGEYESWYNWTNGCIGLANADIDELFLMAKNSHLKLIPIEIDP